MSVMKCPHCGDSGSRVVETRENNEESVTRRRRECDSCGERFTTYEEIRKPSLQVVKSDGQKEPFQREKLKTGVEKACKERPVSDTEIAEIVEDIEIEVRTGNGGEVESREIGDRVIERLKSVDEVAYLRFASVYNSFDDVSAFEEEVESLRSGAHGG